MRGGIGDSNHFLYSLARLPSRIMPVTVSSTTFLNAGSSLGRISA
ncbi:Uncharacterised protein [Bordetella pertussis]|nr:Uncharacterised protein [Bordetella pertussis]